MSSIRKKFSKLYDENIERIFRYIYIRIGSKEVAEDLSSETFTRGWNVFQEREIENPSAFLYQIARNLIVDYYRKNSQFKTISAEYVQMSDPRSDLEEKAFLGSDIEKVRNALSYLKEDYQDVIVWHYLEEMPIKEIAQMAEKSETAIRVMLHRALKALRKNMKPEV